MTRKEIRNSIIVKYAHIPADMHHMDKLAELWNMLNVEEQKYLAPRLVKPMLACKIRLSCGKDAIWETINLMVKVLQDINNDKALREIDKIIGDEHTELTQEKIAEIWKGLSPVSRLAISRMANKENAQND